MIRGAYSCVILKTKHCYIWRKLRKKQETILAVTSVTNIFHWRKRLIPINDNKPGLSPPLESPQNALRYFLGFMLQCYLLLRKHAHSLIKSIAFSPQSIEANNEATNDDPRVHRLGGTAKLFPSRWKRRREKFFRRRGCNCATSGGRELPNWGLNIQFRGFAKIY
jgi:hypothetical protein